jgi:hypothetical protein
MLLESAAAWRSSSTGKLWPLVVAVPDHDWVLKVVFLMQGS